MPANKNYEQAIKDEMYLDIDFDLDFDLPFPEKDEKIGGNYSSEKAKEVSEAAKWRGGEVEKKGGAIKKQSLAIRRLEGGGGRFEVENGTNRYAEQKIDG